MAARAFQGGSAPAPPVLAKSPSKTAAKPEVNLKVPGLMSGDMGDDMVDMSYQYTDRDGQPQVQVEELEIVEALGMAVNGGAQHSAGGTSDFFGKVAGSMGMGQTITTVETSKV